MPTSHDVFVATLSPYQRMRDAFVELRGLLVTWRANNRRADSSLVDEYGDLVSIATFTNIETKIVPDFSKYYNSVKTYNQNSTNESTVVPLEAICKLDDAIMIGDRIKFTHWFPNDALDENGVPLGESEAKEFQVAKVENQVHFGSVSKKITIVPVRDL